MYVNIVNASKKVNIFVLVAQLDRVFGYEPKGQGFESLQARFVVDMVQLVSAPDCGSGCRGFESHYPP